MKHKLKIDFFHDVICGLCYVLSPRLPLLAKEMDLDVNHHAFALPANKNEMIGKFAGNTSTP
ncbi:MAG: DsbA family protein [Colwellia sp.]|nr:DsbA family protein [Colwellia sp.]